MAMTEREAYLNFDQMLNDTVKPFVFGGSEYEPSRVLNEIDPIAYQTAFNDWADAEGIDTDELED